MDMRLMNRNVLLAWTVLAIAALHPPHGSGLPLCWMKASSGIPCPGCGLMRSVSCAARGMYIDAWRYHPFGPLLVLTCIGAALWSLAPQRIQARAMAAGEQHRAALRATYGL